MLIFALAPTLAKASDRLPESAEPFRAYLERCLGVPVEVVRYGSYADTLAALRDGRADAASLGDLAWRSAQQDGTVEPLVSMVAGEERQSTYRSVVVTRPETGILSLPMLSGRTLALVDTQSTSGYAMPRAMLREAGLDPDRDLDSRLMGSHRDVVEAVIAGEVDAGAMHENWLVPPTLERGHEYARIRVLARSREIPRGPVVVRSTLDPELRRRFLAAMLSIHEVDPEAARILLSDGHYFTSTDRRSMPTLKSIAALAGVSYATVSRVINDSGPVKAETKRRVQAIIREVGYAPNGNARVLLGLQMPMVGVVSPVDDAETLRVVGAVHDALREAGVPIVICPAGDSLRDSSAGQLLRDRRLGAIVVPARFADDPEVAELASLGLVVIGLGETGTVPAVIRADEGSLIERTLAAISL